MCFLRHAHYKMQFEPWWKRATRLNQVWSCAVPSLAGGRLDSLRAGCPPKPRYSAGMEQINRWFFPHHSMPISYHLPISMGELLSESLIFRLGHADTYQNQSLYMGLTGAKKSRSTIFWDQFWLNISDHTIYNIYIYILRIIRIIRIIYFGCTYDYQAFWCEKRGNRVKLQDHLTFPRIKRSSRWFIDSWSVGDSLDQSSVGNLPTIDQWSPNINGLFTGVELVLSWGVSSLKTISAQQCPARRFISKFNMLCSYLEDIWVWAVCAKVRKSPL